MNQNRTKVAEFHTAFGIDSPAEPTLDPNITEEDREDLMVLAKELSRVAHLAHFLAEDVTKEDPENGKTRRVPFLRLQLMIEELSEVAQALGIHDIVEVAHEMADLEYVVQGTVLALGMNTTHEACVSEIHRANMSKLDHGKPVLNDAGRVQKGPDFRKASCRNIIIMDKVKGRVA